MGMLGYTPLEIANLTEKYTKLLDDNPEWIEIANRRNKAHVEGVQKFGMKLNGREFEGHDKDKFYDLHIPYMLITLGYNKDVKDDLGMDDEMDRFLRWATYRHVISNPHHPEYWDKENAKVNADVAYKDRDKPRSVIIDATKMPNNYLDEMICDWASVGAERGNSPQSWLENGKDTKWKFTDEQLKYMFDQMEKIWPGGRDETAKVEHKERYFNDVIWDKLNDAWDELEKDNVLFESILNENEELEEFINSLNRMIDQKDNLSKTVDTIDQSKRTPVVDLDGVGSLQSLSFLFSDGVTNYIMTLLDALLNNDYKNVVNNRDVERQGLANVEFGKGYNTKASVPNNFLKGLTRSLDKTNMSKLKNKTMLVTKLYLNMKRFAKNIVNKEQRKEYLKDMKAFFKVADIIKNVINNREKFINVLNKTLVLNESEVIVESGFVNIVKG